MCAGGVYHAGLGGVVYSVSAERSREFGTDLVVSSSEVFAGGSREIPVVGPVREAEGVALRREYG
jgi:tRNA(Arg) A34 adenosine deaminase TadA